MKKKVIIELEEEEIDCLYDYGRHEGHYTLKGYLQALLKNFCYTHVDGYMRYIYRRREWYRTEVDDYIETEEFCNEYFFDFNTYARGKLVKDHRKIKRY